MDYFKELYNKPNSVRLPNPKGFIMHNKFYKKGSLEEKLMYIRYRNLDNNSRYINETRHFSTVDVINSKNKW